MPPKLTPPERLRLIKRVVEGDEKVAQVCREAGISRVLFYRWLARYQKGKADEKLAFLKPHKKGEPLKAVSGPQKLTPQQRLQMIKRVKAGETVANVCQELGISRTIFYCWLKRYEDTPEGQKLEALWDKKPKIERYWRQTPEKYEQAVLNLVIEHPELSTHKLVEFLPQIGGRSILSNHGVQNVLRRHNLTTLETRLAYSRALRHAPQTLDRAIHTFQNLLTFLYVLPVPTRKLVMRVGVSFLLGIFAFVIILGVRSYLGAFAQATLGSKIGLTFATLSLAVGTFFFLYSLKYYFTLTLVLGFSRQISGGEQMANRENGNGGKSIWEKIFGIKTNGNGYGNGNGHQNGNGNGNGQKIFAGGLQANLDHVKLARHPFVSIHLPLYNEKRVVDRLLTAATSQNYENYKVIVIDDSTDETSELLKKWKSHPRVKVIHRESREGFKGGALKVALEQTDSRVEFILVFDADFLPYPDTITQFLKYFQVTAGGLDFGSALKHPSGVPQAQHHLTGEEIKVAPGGSNIAAIQGYQWHVLNKSENWITRGVRSEYAGSYVVERSGGEIMGALKQIAGSVYIIRKDILDRYGWGTSITEDFELTLKLYRDGYKVVYTPYIQTPSECVSTLKRLIRQRMRWAEGHSHNIRKMFWEMVGSSKMTSSEKLEFFYLSPYYLQAALFLIGTFCWFLSEAIFQTRLPFWTSLWGWSLVLTNLFALPLMNTVGLFLEESEERDYTGILSFTVLSYLLAPFQGYAAVKGFLEREEGPWFRTPKTGKITDIFTPGRFARFISGIFGRPAVAPSASSGTLAGKPAFVFLDPKPYTLIPDLNPYLSLATANNQFSNFRIKSRRFNWIGKTVLAAILIITVSFYQFSQNISVIYASPDTFFLDPTASGVITTVVAGKLNTGSIGAKNTNTCARPASGSTGTYEFLSSFASSSCNTTSETESNHIPDSRGFINDTAYGAGVYIPTGTWTFRYSVTSISACSAGVAKMHMNVYQVSIASGAISTYTYLFNQESATDMWTGADFEETITVSPNPSQVNFDDSKKYLYVEFFANVTTGCTNNTASNRVMRLDVGSTACSTTDCNITSPTVVIPENVVYFLALSPFIPMVILWIKRRQSLKFRLESVD